MATKGDGEAQSADAEMTAAAPSAPEAESKATSVGDIAMDSSEEASDEPNEYQKDGFVVANDEAEEEEEGDEEGEGNAETEAVRKPTKRSTNPDEAKLDEDDFLLIEVRVCSQ